MDQYDGLAWMLDELFQIEIKPMPEASEETMKEYKQAYGINQKAEGPEQAGRVEGGRT